MYFRRVFIKSVARNVAKPHSRAIYNLCPVNKVYDSLLEARSDYDLRYCDYECAYYMDGVLTHIKVYNNAQKVKKYGRK